MAVLEQITKLKNQGIPTGDIINYLRENGVSPKEINEALSQSEIKSAINKAPQTDSAQQNPYPQFQNSPQQFQPPQNYPDPNEDSHMQNSNPQMQNQEFGMQPSISSQQDQNSSDEDSKQALEKEYPQETEEQTTPEEEYARYPESGSYYQDYGNQGYNPPQQIDIETIRDIATQIIEENIKSYGKEFTELSGFRKEADDKLKEFEERITKIEENFQRLQWSLIKKADEYGDDIKNISKELVATQESFSKILDPLTDNIRELQKITEKNIQEKAPSEINPVNENIQDKIQENANIPKEKAKPSIMNPDSGTRKKLKKQNPSFEDFLR